MQIFLAFFRYLKEIKLARERQISKGRSSVLCLSHGIFDAKKNIPQTIGCIMSKCNKISLNT